MPLLDDDGYAYEFDDLSDGDEPDFGLADDDDYAWPSFCTGCGFASTQR